MEFREVEINGYPDYSINQLGQVKNILKGNTIKLFDTYFIDLYKQEPNKKYKTKTRVKLVDLMIEHFVLKPGETKEKFYISWIDHNLLNCSLSNLKVKMISYFYYKIGKQFNLYDSYNKTFQIVDSIPTKFKTFHLLNGYEPNEEGIVKFVEDFRLWNKQLKGYKLKYEFWYSHTYAIDGILRKLSPKSLFSHEPIDRVEYIWMDKSTKGSLIHCTPGIYKTYGYDFKSCYAFVMSREGFKIPTKKGIELNLLELPDEIQFGYYNVKIISTNPEVSKIFRFNPLNVYTHISLRFALKYQEEFGFEIELILNDKPNAYVYSNDCLVSGKELFGKYYDTMIKIRTNYPQNKLCKFMLSSLWGTVSRQYFKTKTDEELEEKNINIGMNIEEDDQIFIDEDFEGNNKYLDITRPFVHNIRLKTWLKSAVNNIMASIFIKLGTENIIRVHTDGFSSLVPVDFQIENLLPDPKYTGTFQYTNIKLFSPV